FQTNGYTTADLLQNAALVPHDLMEVGIQVASMPKRIAPFVLDEKKLAGKLADEVTRDEEEPRVLHDVDCVAAILTVRGDQRADSIADAKAVFVTTTTKVITEVDEWYREEGQAGISPVIHIRALSNLAWLRAPMLASGLKLHELIVLCESALRPS